jgi:hypothetical protein
MTEVEKKTMVDFELSVVETARPFEAALKPI